MNQTQLRILLPVIMLVTLAGCISNLSGPVESYFRAENAGVTCTEAYIRLESSENKQQVEIYYGEKRLKSYNLAKNDSTVYVDSLTPGKDYNLKIKNIQLGKEAQLNIKTMDTTDHEIEWTKLEFGGVYGGSTLNDVAIIDENNIWAVGDFYMEPGGQPYAVARWDGSKWNFEKAFYKPYPEFSKWNYPLDAICAFDKDNIFAAYGGVLLKWQGGTDWETVAQIGDTSETWGSINKLWGSSPENIYCVAGRGYIYHYYGSGWKKLERCTTTDLGDIWGDFNTLNGKYEILALTNDFNTATKSQIVKIVENTCCLSENEGIQTMCSGLWFKSGLKYYTTGADLYEKSKIDNYWLYSSANRTTTRRLSSGLRGNDINDIYVTGSRGKVMHYNGVSWKEYFGDNVLTLGHYSRVAVKGKIVAVAGWSDNKAVILIGKKK